MPCKPLETIKESVDIEVELAFQYDRLRLIFNNDEERCLALRGERDQPVDEFLVHAILTVCIRGTPRLF